MENCVFCDIVQGKIPCHKVYEDETILVFKDLEPQAPVHFLIIPKKHVSDLLAVSELEKDFLYQVQQVVKVLVEQHGLTKKGFRLVNNCGQEGGQTVLHLHFHLLGGRNFTWPPG